MTKETKGRLPGIYILDDGRFRVRATVACPRTGKMIERQATLQHGAQEWEALRELERLKADLRGGEVSPKVKRLTVRGYAERWLEAKAARLKPSTAARYADELARFILPQLGDLYLDALTRRDVERWVAWAERATTGRGELYASVTIGAWWSTLTTLLKDAAAEMGHPDPTARVRSPNNHHKSRCAQERRTLTREQLQEFLEAFEAQSPARYAEAALIAYTGLRMGEVYGLAWEHVDFGARILSVKQAAWKGAVGKPKTGAERDVPMGDHLIKILQEHRSEQLRAQGPGLVSGIVFPSERGTWRRAGPLRDKMGEVSDRIGLDVRVTPRVLRRTFNTLMLLAGVDRLVLRSMMGHSGEEMTARYAGIAPSEKLAAVSKVF